MEIYKVDATTRYLNIMLYGEPGVGKTWLASTAQNHPKMKNVLFLNVEGGLTTVASRGDILAIDIVGIERFKPTPDLPELPPGSSTLEDVFWKLKQKEGAFADINTVVIDSGTEMQTLGLEKLAREGKRKDKSGRRGEDELYLEDYGRNTAQLKRILRWYRDLPMHVIITALPQFVYPKTAQANTVQEPTEIRPSFTNKLSVSAMGYVDFVWYIYQDGQGRHILTQEHGKFKAKTRGLRFADALGQVADIKDETDPESTGLDLSDIYSLFLKTEKIK